MERGSNPFLRIEERLAGSPIYLSGGTVPPRPSPLGGSPPSKGGGGLHITKDSAQKLYGLKGLEQFAYSKQLGIVPEGSEYIEKGDSWGYLTPLQIQQQATQEEQAEAVEALKDWTTPEGTKLVEAVGPLGGTEKAKKVFEQAGFLDRDINTALNLFVRQKEDAALQEKYKDWTTSELQRGKVTSAGLFIPPPSEFGVRGGVYTPPPLGIQQKYYETQLSATKEIEPYTKVITQSDVSDLMKSGAAKSDIVRLAAAVGKPSVDVVAAIEGGVSDTTLREVGISSRGIKDSKDFIALQTKQKAKEADLASRLVTYTKTQYSPFGTGDPSLIGPQEVTDYGAALREGVLTETEAREIGFSKNDIEQMKAEPPPLWSQFIPVYGTIRYGQYASAGGWTPMEKAMMGVSVLGDIAMIAPVVGGSAKLGLTAAKAELTGIKGLSLGTRLGTVARTGTVLGWEGTKGLVTAPVQAFKAPGTFFKGLWEASVFPVAHPKQFFKGLGGLGELAIGQKGFGFAKAAGKAGTEVSGVGITKEEWNRMSGAAQREWLRSVGGDTTGPGGMREVVPGGAKKVYGPTGLVRTTGVREVPWGEATAEYSVVKDIPTGLEGGTRSPTARVVEPEVFRTGGYVETPGVVGKGKVPRFTTARGSTYEIVGEGTQRTVTPEIQAEQGLPSAVRPTSAKTYYLTSEQMSKVGVGTGYPHAVNVKPDGGIVLGVEFTSPTTGKQVRIFTDLGKVATEPKVGLTPFEVGSTGGRNWTHFGDKIISVKTTGTVSGGRVWETFGREGTLIETPVQTLEEFKGVLGSVSRVTPRLQTRGMTFKGVYPQRYYEGLVTAPGLYGVPAGEALYPGQAFAGQVGFGPKGTMQIISPTFGETWPRGGQTVPRVFTAVRGPLVGGGVTTQRATTATMTPEQMARVTGVEPLKGFGPIVPKIFPIKYPFAKPSTESTPFPSESPFVGPVVIPKPGILPVPLEVPTQVSVPAPTPVLSTLFTPMEFSSPVPTPTLAPTPVPAPPTPLIPPIPTPPVPPTPPTPPKPPTPPPPSIIPSGFELPNIQSMGMSKGGLKRLLQGGRWSLPSLIAVIQDPMKGTRYTYTIAKKRAKKYGAREPQAVLGGLRL